MRRILYYSLLCVLWVSVNSCKDDEAAQPPTPSFTVDPKAGLMSNTEFTFVVDQVSAGTVSLLPYGQENPNDAGVIIPASSFVNGKATVKFTYGRVGTFNPVVVANNHSGDGESIKNTYSPSQAVVISNDQTAITEFTFDGSSETKINDVAHTITVQMPYDKGLGIAALKAKFTASPFAKVFVGTTEQTSGTTANNFSSPVVYTVKSQNGLKQQDWTVTVNTTPIQKTNTIKSLTDIVSKTGSLKGRTLPAYINNSAPTTDRYVVLYDNKGADLTKFDSVALDYALDGSLSYAKFQSNNKKLKGKDTVNLKNATPKIVVTPQDSLGADPSGRATYTVYTAEAPNVTVSFPALVPSRTANNDRFAIGINVITDTDIEAINTMVTVDDPAGSTHSTITLDGDLYVPGMAVDYTKPVTLEITVTKGTLVFVAKYTITVTVK